MLGAHIDTSTKHNITVNTSFVWAPNSTLCNLGIQLATPTSCLLYLNFLHLISKLQKGARDLEHVQASWAGHITLSKMYLLPHVLNMFRTTPPSFYNPISTKYKLSNTYIWNGKHSGIKSATLCKPTSAVGMGAPNVKAYFKATILDQSKTWWESNSQHTWLQIERTVLAVVTK